MGDCRSFIGMFSTINKAEIKDLTISNSYFYAYNGIDSLAAIAGEAYCSKIENCHTIDTYCYATSAEVAQILGTAISTVYIKNCSAEGKVESSHSHEIAGITAGANDGTIEGCINNAEIINNYGTASGICGLLSDSAAQTDKNGNVSYEKSDNSIADDQSNSKELVEGYVSGTYYTGLDNQFPDISLKEINIIFK